MWQLQVHVPDVSGTPVSIYSTVPLLKTIFLACSPVPHLAWRAMPTKEVHQLL